MWIEAIRDGVKVRILTIQFGQPKTATNYCIVYADADGVLHIAYDISEFCMCE